MACPNLKDKRRKFVYTCFCDECEAAKRAFEERRIGIAIRNIPNMQAQSVVRRKEVDLVAVDRAVTGERPDYMTPAERREAARQLIKLGKTYRQAAKILGVTKRSIERYMQVTTNKETS